MVLDYYEAVETAIGKYAGRRTDEEKSDIRQTAWLALVEAGDRVNNPKIAYKICKDSVLYYLYRGYGKQVDADSLSEPSIFRKAENQQAQEFDVSSGLDVERIGKFIGRLSLDEQIILKMFYGLPGEQQKLETIADWMGKPEIWVRRRKKLALKKLRILLGEGNE